MAEQKDDSGQAAKQIPSTKRAGPGGGAEPPAAHSGVVLDRVAGDDDRSGSRPGSADKTSATVVRRRQRYLIGFRSLPGMAPSPSDPFLEKLAEMEGVEITRHLRGGGLQAPGMVRSAAEPAAIRETVVARMDEQRGEALRQNAPPHVIVEIDAPLGYSDMYSDMAAP